jgi:magnesium transporter
MAQRGPLIALAQKFFEHDTIAAVRTLETIDEAEAVKVLRSLPPSLTAQAFQYLPVAHAAGLLKDLPQDVFEKVVQKLDPMQGAAILSSLPDDVRQNLLEHVPEKTKERIRDLLQFPENSAGRIMSTDFLAFHSSVKVKDAIRRIRSLARRNGPASYVYVLDPADHLVGVINMRDLMLAPGGAELESVVKGEVFAVNAFLDREEVASELSKRRYFAAPVVDSENRMLGVIRSDQLISHVQAEATEDIQKIFGAGGDERSFSPISFSLRKRLPWLHVNLATAFLAASVVGLFQDIIARITVLAVFLPVVAGQGGNAGAQSLAVVMRGLVMREIPHGKAMTLILKESAIGALNGLIIGIVTALVAWVWHGNPFLGLVIGLAMIVNLLAAGFSGAAIPITMKALGFDPAQSSNIVLTTVTDVVGFFSFLGFAVVFQAYLA